MLTVVINLVMASAFASILIYAMELIPDRIGLIGGLFYGLNFGLGGIAAAILGGLADHIGIERVYQAVLVPAARRPAGLVPAAHRGASRRSLTSRRSQRRAATVQFATSIRDGPAPSLGMGDKSLKSKQRDQKQKDAAKVGVAAVAKAKQDANAHAKQPTSKTGR